MLVYVSAILSFWAVFCAPFCVGAVDGFLVLVPCTGTNTAGSAYLMIAFTLTLLASVAFFPWNVPETPAIVIDDLQLTVYSVAVLLLCASAIVGVICSVPTLLTLFLQITFVTLFEYNSYWLMAWKLAGIYGGAVVCMLCSVLATLGLKKHFNGSLESMSDVTAMLSKAIPVLVALLLTFNATVWCPRYYEAPKPVALTICFISMITVFSYFMGTWLIVPKIKELAFRRYPQEYSEYLSDRSNEGSPVRSSRDNGGHLFGNHSPRKQADENGHFPVSSLEASRIGEVLAIVQACFTIGTFPGYAYLFLKFISRLCVFLGWSNASLGMLLSIVFSFVAGMVLIAFRMTRRAKAELQLDSLHGLAVQLSTVITLIALQIAGLSGNPFLLLLVAILTVERIHQGRLHNRATIYLGSLCLISIILVPVIQSFRRFLLL